jgi:hypothetical protein
MATNADVSNQMMMKMMMAVMEKMEKMEKNAADNISSNENSSDTSSNGGDMPPVLAPIKVPNTIAIAPTPKIITIKASDQPCGPRLAKKPASKECKITTFAAAKGSDSPHMMLVGDFTQQPTISAVFGGKTPFKRTELGWDSNAAEHVLGIRNALNEKHLMEPILTFAGSNLTKYKLDWLSTTCVCKADADISGISEEAVKTPGLRILFYAVRLGRDAPGGLANTLFQKAGNDVVDDAAISEMLKEIKTFGYGWAKNSLPKGIPTDRADRAAVVGYYLAAIIHIAAAECADAEAAAEAAQSNDGYESA